MNYDTNQAEQKKIIHRLRRTEGQIRGVQKMIEENKECCGK